MSNDFPPVLATETGTHRIVVNHEHARQAMDLSRTILDSCWAGPEARQLAALVAAWLRTPVLEWEAYETLRGECWEAVIPRRGMCIVQPVVRQGLVRWEGYAPGALSSVWCSPEEARAWCQRVADEMYGEGGAK